MHVRMDDDSEVEYGPGDAFYMPPGHDAWIVGDEKCVLIDVDRHVELREAGLTSAERRDGYVGPSST